MSRAVVLGGGPAGLYAALLLARRGIPVTLLEQEGKPGGLTAGTRVAGMAVDYGSHRLHPSIDDGILDDLSSLLGDGLQTRARHGRIHLDDAWISFPLSALEMVSRLRPSTLVRLGLGAIAATFTTTRPTSFADLVSTTLGRPMGDLFYFPYARKIWGLAPQELSGEQARRRISADSPWKLAGKLISPGSRHRFLYPKGGFGQIPVALTRSAVDAGVDIRLGAPARSVRRSGSELVVETPAGAMTADLLLSTIPVTVLARLLDPPEHIRQAAGILRYRAMTLVYLVVPVDRWTEYDAHYFPSQSVPFTRISEPKNYRDGDDPAGRTVLCVEIPCDVGDRTWTAGEMELMQIVRDGILGSGLPDPGSKGVVHRIPNAYPIYREGSEDALARVTSWLDGIPRVVTFGRQGLFAHDNTHHALTMARDAVACVSDGLGFDAASWDRARARFATHVVED